MTDHNHTRNTIRLCIVGLGPRGLSLLERLSANSPELVRPHDVLHVHIADPYATEGGRVWRHQQHPELLMNTVASQVSMFVDSSVDCAGPVVPGPSLYEWARFINQDELSPDLPKRVRTEAGRLGPDSYPSRALYGRYLTWTLQHLIRTTPHNVHIHLHPTTVVDVRDGEDGSQTVVLSTGRKLTRLHAVVLAQGHLPAATSTAEARLEAFAARHGLHYIPPGNPADVRLDAIAPGQPTIVQGLGLNFFDYMALLTIGRGGSFHRDGDGELRYQPSGREPRLIAGSRRGVPFHARGENQKGVSGRHEPLFLTQKVITEMRDQASNGMPVNFRTDVWPLIDREARTVYYSTLVAARHGTGAAELFLRRYVEVSQDAPYPDRADTSPLTTPESDAELALLAGYGIAAGEHWDWRVIAYPYADATIATTAEFRDWLLSYLRNDVREALRGNVDSPTKAALDVLRDLRNEIRLVVDHGGLSGDSYREDLQSWYTPLNAYVSIGPPVQRIEQLIALIDAGVVEIPGANLVVESHDREAVFLARSAMLPNEPVRATALIEARLPETNLHHTTDPLLRNLLARGECRSHRVPNADGTYYPAGGLAVTQRPYHLIDADDRPHPRRFAFGVPTETVHWVTAAGIRPGVNSVILADADALARAAIAVATKDLRPALSMHST
jgi:uncharacterized NAD(P)/FAD-binding protein YdhS